MINDVQFTHAFPWQNFVSAIFNCNSHTWLYFILFCIFYCNSQYFQALNMLMHKWLAGLYTTGTKPAGVTYPWRSCVNVTYHVLSCEGRINKNIVQPLYIVIMIHSTISWQSYDSNKLLVPLTRVCSVPPLDVPDK